MKKIFIRVVALVVLFLNIDETKASTHKPFAYKASGGDILDSDYIAFLKGIGNPKQGTWWKAPSGESIYIYCNPEKTRAFVNSTNTKGYTYDQIRTFPDYEILGNYQNTGIRMGIAEAINQVGPVLPGKNYYGWPDRRAIAKANCWNEQWMHTFPEEKKPEPKPVTFRIDNVYSECLDDIVQMGSFGPGGGRYSVDSSIYLLNDVWYRFNGSFKENGNRNFVPINCKERVVVEHNYNQNITHTHENIYYDPPTTYQQMPAQTPMGRVYSSPGWWESPPMPNYPVRQRSVNISIGLMVMPNINRAMYNWTPVPGNFYQGQQVYQGSPFYSDNPAVYSAGNPFYTQNNQFFNQDPNGGGTFTGAGNTGVAQRVW